MDSPSPQGIKELHKVLLQATTLGCQGEYTEFIVNAPLPYTSSDTCRNRLLGGRQCDYVKTWYGQVCAFVSKVAISKKRETPRCKVALKDQVPG